MIDLDDDALAEAAKVLGTTSKKETVNKALREVVERERRMEALLAQQEMAARGEIDWAGWEEEQAAEKAIAAKVAARFAERDAAERRTPA
jgi:Arc/MetJ family transcription regulator